MVGDNKIQTLYWVTWSARMIMWPSYDAPAIFASFRNRKISTCTNVNFYLLNLLYNKSSFSKDFTHQSPHPKYKHKNLNINLKISFSKFYTPVFKRLSDVYADLFMYSKRSFSNRFKFMSRVFREGCYRSNPSSTQPQCRRQECSKRIRSPTTRDPSLRINHHHSSTPEVRQNHPRSKS